MSMNALILGTVEWLRSDEGLKLDTTQCDEQPDGQPPPMAGELYYAVHQGEWTNRHTECLDEQYSLQITITRRHGYAPADRSGVAVMREIRDLAAALRAKIHGNDLVRLAWNRKMPDDRNEFVEPLRFLGANVPQVKNPDWFWAEGRDPAPTGVAITLTFGMARLIQRIEDL